MHKAYLGLGSNLGDRLWHLDEAVRRLHESPSMEVRSVSSVYESAAVGNTEQPDFLNIVVLVETTHAPHELLTECLKIEAGLGRVRRERWGPRTLDIDILLYDELILADETLTLPHPRMKERSFVLRPLAEIAPDLKLESETVKALTSKVGQAGLRKIEAKLPVSSGLQPFTP